MGQPRQDFGCGAASLMMLLHHYRDYLPMKVPTYQDLCEMSSWLTVDPAVKGQDPKWGKGGYVSDVERALKGIRSITNHRIKYEEINQEDARGIAPYWKGA